jgi:hypothetical protein
MFGLLEPVPASVLAVGKCPKAELPHWPNMIPNGQGFMTKLDSSVFRINEHKS